MHNIGNYIGMEYFTSGNRRWIINKKIYIGVKITINEASIEKFLVTFKINNINKTPVKIPPE